MVKCGILDNGEFIEGYCQYPSRIDYWDNDGHARFGKVVHHVNRKHFDDRPSNRMTCHQGCHSFNHNASRKIMKRWQLFDYNKLFEFVKTGIVFSELGYGSPTLNNIYHTMLGGVDFDYPEIPRDDLKKILDDMVDKGDIVKQLIDGEEIFGLNR